MSNSKTASQQLEEAIFAAEKAAQLVEELKAESRTEDLETVKKLVARHAITATELRGYLRTKFLCLEQFLFLLRNIKSGIRTAKKDNE